MEELLYTEWHLKVLISTTAVRSAEYLGGREQNYQFSCVKIVVKVLPGATGHLGPITTDFYSPPPPPALSACQGSRKNQRRTSLPAAVTRVLNQFMSGAVGLDECILFYYLSLLGQSGPECSTLIGRDPRDTLLSLVEPYYPRAKVYAITTHLKACKMSLCGAFCCFRCVVMK